MWCVNGEFLVRGGDGGYLGPDVNRGVSVGVVWVAFGVGGGGDVFNVYRYRLVCK